MFSDRDFMNVKSMLHHILFFSTIQANLLKIIHRDSVKCSVMMFYEYKINVLVLSAYFIVQSNY